MKIEGDGERESPGAQAHERAGLLTQANDVRAHALMQARMPALPAVASTQSFNIEEAQSLLAQIVGDENVAASSHLGVSPASAEESCEVLRLASSEGWKVIPAGSGTWLDAGNPLERACVIVSTRRMSKVIEHEPADLVARAEAGVTLSALNAELARAGQWLPLDPPDQGSASLGGVVATGLSGAQSLGYGSPRGHVIGMRVALADGRTIKAGGRVVKNVAGYDLCKLFTGSYGTLGLILELIFKLRPLPSYTTTVAANGSPDSLLRAARSVLNARLLPVAVEMLSSGAASRIGVPTEGAQTALLVRYAGTHGTVAFQTEETIRMLHDEDAKISSYASDDDESYWRGLSALALEHKGQLAWRANVLPSELQAFLNQVLNDDGADLTSSSSLWHAGVGDGRLRVISSESGDVASYASRLDSFRARARALGGSLVVDSATAQLKHSIDAWGLTGATVPLMRRIKDRLDPANVFSPGRLSL